MVVEEVESGTLPPTTIPLVQPPNNDVVRLPGREHEDTFCVFALICSVLFGFILLPFPLMVVFWDRAFRFDILKFTLADSSQRLDCNFCEFQCKFYVLGFGNILNDLQPCGIVGFGEARSNDFTIFDCDEARAFAGTRQMADALCELASGGSGSRIIKGWRLFVTALTFAMGFYYCLGAFGIGIMARLRSADPGRPGKWPSSFILLVILALVLLPLAMAFRAKSIMQDTSYNRSVRFSIAVNNNVSPSGVYDSLTVTSFLFEFVKDYYIVAYVQLGFVASALVLAYCTYGKVPI